MDNKEYIIGQRWVSSTESELGLGIVVENSGRMISLSFPAAGERRTYAVGNAPLSRVEYSVGDQISSDEGLKITVSERMEQDGVYIYVGEDEAGNIVELDELDLDSFVQFSKPQDRLFAGQVDKISSFQLRVETLALMRKHQQSPAYGLLGPRVQLLPHQFYIASQVTQRHSPRVLLADEVGLGKTIEAGLILHHQIVTGSASRVLIVVPDSLVHQWLVEMLRRFNLYFTILDEERCYAIAESDEETETEIDPDAEAAPEFEIEREENVNPFETSQLVLCSLSFLVGNPDRHAQALEADWDLLVVDEAHHLTWSEEKVSPAYQCIEALARVTSGLLLLTATPEQLGVESHFARLRLLDPDRYFNLQEFRDEDASYQQISDLIEHLQHEDAQQRLRDLPELADQLEQYLGNDSVTTILESEDFDQAIDLAINNLLDRHGTGRVLFRNTREAVKGFPDRKLNAYALEKPDLGDQDVSLDELLHPELLLGDQWLTKDPRVEWLADWLSQNRDQKILVICALAKTALELEEHLRTRSGVRSAVFHEGLSLVARDRAAAYFGDEEEGAQILICSEIGSEGRNFQFAHHLVLFDLPLNPDLLEQRIGRLDRIGQTETVQIHVPYHEATPQAGLLRWYHEGLNAFERVCPVSVNVFQIVGDRMQTCLLNNDEIFDDLIRETHDLTEDLLEKLQLGRDRLLELSSCHPKKAEEVIGDVVSSSGSLELESYMEKVFDHFGVDHQVHSQHAVVLHPGDHMSCHTFPGLSEDGMTATYRRAQAMIREDMHFLTLEHPMVSGATDMILSGDFGNTAFCTLKTSALKPGTLLLEAIFILHCPAPKRLQLHRYLPLTTIRIVVDSLNRDLSEVLSASKLDQMAQRVPLRSVQELIKHARPQISKLVDAAEKSAAPQRDGLIETALQQMRQILDAEIERLQALAEVNPTIRKDEIEYMQTSSEQLQRFLQGATLKLDAIRVAMAT